MVEWLWERWSSSDECVASWDCSEYECICVASGAGRAKAEGIGEAGGGARAAQLQATAGECEARGIAAILAAFVIPLHRMRTVGDRDNAPITACA